LVSLNPEGHHDLPPRDRRALAPCWLSPLLALEISQQAGRRCRHVFGYARGGNDVLTGNGLENVLYGDAETLSDHARGGNDRLISGTGIDHMYGDAATIADTARTVHDTFVFAPNNGQDFIYDFQQGQDRIEVDGGAVHDFNDLLIEHLDANGDGITDSVVHFDQTDTVTVYITRDTSTTTTLPLASEASALLGCSMADRGDGRHRC
jgi:Ca2+-binding RTX toxin-like protein